MIMKKVLLLVVLLSTTLSVFASREKILLNDNWRFRFSYQVQPRSGQRVDLPHTWNAVDALTGKQDYYRGLGNYEKQLFVKPEWEGKRLFLRFEGAGTVTNLFINSTHVGEHRGAYGAFVFEITDYVEYSKPNLILVRVNNAPQLDIMPLVGDFNMYGGIYRDVNLIVTEPLNISLTDYASPGVYLIQNKVTKEEANVMVKTMLSNGANAAQQAQLQIKIKDGQKTVQEQTKNISLLGRSEIASAVEFTIAKPHLWNGRKDPFMYRVVVELIAGGKVIDRVTQPLGLRFYHVDANEGFFLNGEHLQLRGVCRHQDRAELGAALHRMHHEEDAAIMAEMGTNAVRLAHYPQATYFYELMDEYGIVTWAEIPFIGPGGYLDRGFVDQVSFRENGKEQLIELIRQHYNHPSICFWGLFNELKTIGDNPTEYIRELNALAHKEDPTRPTTAASFLGDGDDINKVTDLIGWNKYYGWYGGSPNDMGRWADNCHKNFPQYKIAVTEYGAGASIYHQQDSMMKAGQTSGWWHPESFQTYYHIGNWKAINERPYIWGSFIWNLFDFGAAHRTEGDRPGINDKGIVTFDRKIKKDAFYFYKANWNKEDKFVYISNRRNTERTNKQTDIMIFSNLPEIELLVNGKSLGKIKSDNYATFEWNAVTLTPGENKIEARSTDKKNAATDHVVWRLQ